MGFCRVGFCVSGILSRGICPVGNCRVGKCHGTGLTEPDGWQTYKYLRSDLYSEVKNFFPSICNQPHAYRFLILMRDVNAAPVSRFALRAIFG